MNKSSNHELYAPCIQQIGNILTANVQRIEKTGLIFGHIGVMLFLYHYGQYTGISQYEDNAEAVFDFVTEDHMNKLRRTFFDGLYGVGWAVKYLAEHRLAEVDDDTLKDYDEIAERHYTSADFIVDMQCDIPLFSKGLYCCDLKNDKAVKDALLIIQALTKNESKTTFKISFLNSMTYFLEKCMDNPNYADSSKSILDRMPPLYESAIEKNKFDNTDILLLKQLKMYGLQNIFLPEISFNSLNDLFANWQSIVYDNLFDSAEMPSVADVQAYIDHINQDMPVKQLSLHGLSALGINLIKKSSN